ncbi:hypothetical protein ACFL6G_05425 [candidate division KSB1 bacterium]
MTQHILIKHRVEDFDKWFKLFLEDESNRKANGVNHHNLFQLSGDENDVIVHLMLDDPEKFKSFMESKDLEGIMEKAGVLEKPVIYFNK